MKRGAKKRTALYLRRYALWIPGDCVASEKDAWRRDALAYMARVLKARVEPADPIAGDGEHAKRRVSLGDRRQQTR